MTDYVIKNTSDGSCSYVGSNGKRINFNRGEEKKLSTLPPEAQGKDSYEDVPGYEIEELGKSETKETTEGGE